MGYNLLINGVHWGCNPFTNLTSWDIQVEVEGHGGEINPINGLWTSRPFLIFQGLYIDGFLVAEHFHGFTRVPTYWGLHFTPCFTGFFSHLVGTCFPSWRSRWNQFSVPFPWDVPTKHSTKRYQLVMWTQFEKYAQVVKFTSWIPRVSGWKIPKNIWGCHHLVYTIGFTKVPMGWVFWPLI